MRILVATLRPAALVAALAVPMIGAVSLAQDSGIISKLEELTRRKGYKDLALRAACEQLGLGIAAKNCLVYQAAYGTHFFNVLNTSPRGSVDIILHKHDGPKSYKLYLTSPDGKLRSAASLQKAETGDVWSKMPADSVQTQTEFAEEIAYWRTKTTELENEPDRCSKRWNSEHPKDRC
jgi:hypothetical protein